MDHTMMNHSEMDHSGMDHGSMDHGSMDHSGSGLGCDMDMMMMQMWFTTDVKCTILFEQWKTTSVGSMIGSCVGILAMAILYEGLKYFRERLHRRSYVAINFSKVSTPGANGAEVNQTKTSVSCMQSMCSGSHFIQTLLHCIQLALSYLLMLIVMTYNVWPCLAVVLGCTIGYFLFGWQKGYMVDITEHCH